MTPIEHYWPPEMLAAVFPDRFGHLAPKAGPALAGRATVAPPYTVETVTGGCDVIRPEFEGIRSAFPNRKP